MKESGQSYSKTANLPEKTDGIIIGSGIGGLCVAALLAKSGKRILVLEQHHVIGGFTHSFTRGDYEWDVGLHYIGSVLDKKSMVRKVFDYITNSRLEWTAMDEQYDKAVFGDNEYAFYKGKEKCRSQFKIYFPEKVDHQAIDKYFLLLDEVDAVGMAYYADKVIPEFLSGIIGGFLRRPLLKYADKTTRQVLDEITDNEELKGVLTAQYGDYGLPPGESSFYMHAMVANHYMNGGAYPVGGASAIAHAICSVIEENGGMVLKGAEVLSVVVKENKACGVKMKDGKIIPAQIIISDAGVKNTFLGLLDKSTATKYGLAEKTTHLTPSLAHVCLYVGLKKSAKELELPKCNYWVFPPHFNHDENQAAYKQITDPLPVAYISFPSAKDSDWENRHPGKSTAEIVILLPFSWFKKWENTSWNNRGEEYEALKEQLSSQLLEKLFLIKPNLKEEIDYYELSTPLSTQTFMHSMFGEIYGLAHTPERFRQHILRPSTPVKNLYLTGQDVFTCGVSGALMGGVLCASAIFGKNMLSVMK